MTRAAVSVLVRICLEGADLPARRGSGRCAAIGKPHRRRSGFLVPKTAHLHLQELVRFGPRERSEGIGLRSSYADVES